MASSIYLSNWEPKGIRDSWERASIGTGNAHHILSPYGVPGQIIDACAWADEAGVLRFLVADTDTDRRLTLRRSKGWKFSNEAKARSGESNAG